VNPINIEDKEKNFILLNEGLQKAKCNKPVDYMSLAKGKFQTNFEFLQFIYDYILKNFPETIGNVKYNAYEVRLNCLKSVNSKINEDNIKKYLPNHLIPSENTIKYEKTKNNNSNNEDNAEKDRINILLDKYKDFLTLLKEDLKKSIENNLILSADIIEIEEEKNYYLEKLNSIHSFVNSLKEKGESENLNEVNKILNHVPEDFK
jgi:hypothetical protein